MDGVVRCGGIMACEWLGVTAKGKQIVQAEGDGKLLSLVTVNNEGKSNFFLVHVYVGNVDAVDQRQTTAEGTEGQGHARKGID